MNSLYIVGIDVEREAWQGHAIRGLRAVWKSLQVDNDLSYGIARRVIEGFAEDPSEAPMVGGHEDENVIHEAIGQGIELSEGVLTFGVNLASTALEVPEAPAAPEPDDQDEDLLLDVFSPAAYKTAIAFLALSNGNPTIAYHRTWLMERATEDLALWEEVRAVIEAVFPPADGGDPNVVVMPS